MDRHLRRNRLLINILINCRAAASRPWSTTLVPGKGKNSCDIICCITTTIAIAICVSIIRSLAILARGSRPAPPPCSRLKVCSCTDAHDCGDDSTEGSGEAARVRSRATKRVAAVCRRPRPCLEDRWQTRPVSRKKSPHRRYYSFDRMLLMFEPVVERNTL